MAPAMTTTKAPTRFQLSRLNRTASGLAVYASSGVLPRKTQNSLPAAGQALPDGLGYPQGCYERFLMLLILLSRAFLALGHTGFSVGRVHSALFAPRDCGKGEVFVPELACLEHA